MSQAQVVTGMFFPSAGVRILIPLVVSAFMEEASGEAMIDLSDYNIGMSVGGMASTAFAMRGANGRAKFSAKDVLYDTVATCAVMFGQDETRVLINNIRRDVPKLTSELEKSLMMRTILGQLERHMPDPAASRYDNGLLARMLEQRFEGALMRDAGKSNFVLAHNMDTAAPAIFGHIDEAAFPGGDGELAMRGVAEGDAPVPGYIPVHSHVGATDGILAATAIPGLIGYKQVPGIQGYFMDAGCLGMPALLNVAEDMHQRAEKRYADAPRPIVPQIPMPQAEPTWWQRLMGQNVAPAPHTPKQPPVQAGPGPVASRLIVLGIGTERGLPYDIDGGIAVEAGNIVRAAGDMVAEASMMSLRRRFNRRSEEVTSRSAVTIIDAPIYEPGNRDMPSVSIKDGRVENLRRLLHFGRRLAVESRAVICDEIGLRLNTLADRGGYDPARLAAARAQLDFAATEKGAAALCDRFMDRALDIEGLLKHHNLPLPQGLAAAPRKAQSWLSFGQRAAAAQPA